MAKTTNLEIDVDAIIGGGPGLRQAIVDGFKKIDAAFAAGALPTVTGADDGKVLKVVDGAWAVGDDATGA